MEIENDELITSSSLPPHTEDYDAVLQSVASSMGTDFLSFDTDGLKYISEGIISSISVQPRFPIHLNVYETMEFIGKYGSGKSAFTYYIIAHVVASKKVGGLEMDVVFFDVDRKLNLSLLMNTVLSLFSSIQNETERINLYKEALNRIIIYKPTNLFHFSTVLSSLLFEKKYRIRLVVVESLSSYLFDIPCCEYYQTLFKSIIHKLKEVIRVYKASLLCVSPKVSKSSSYYYMPIQEWFSFHRSRILFTRKVSMESPEMEVAYTGVDLQNKNEFVFHITENGVE